MLKKIILYLILTAVIVGLSGCSNNIPSTTTSSETSESTDGTNNNDENTSESNTETVTVLPDFNGYGNTSTNLFNDGIAAEEDGFVYHSDSMMRGNIWRTSMESGESELILKGSFHSINVNNGYLFVSGYEDDGDELFSGRDGMFLMSIKDKNLLLIKEGDFEYMTLYNNWIYYVDVIDGGLYRIRADGSDDTLLFADTYNVFAIANDQIFMQTDVLSTDGYDYIYTLPLEGGNPELFMSDSIWGGEFELGANHIYYLTRDDLNYYHQIDLDANNKVPSFDFYTSYINITDKYIYYIIHTSNGEIKRGIYRTNLDGSDKQLFYTSDDFIFSLNVAGGYLFWHTNDDQRRLTMMSEAGGSPSYVEQLLD